MYPRFLCVYLFHRVSRGLSLSLSLLCLSQSLAVSLSMSLSHASPRPPLLQRASPSWPHTPTPSSQEFPGQAQLPHPQTRGSSQEGGLGLVAATFTAMVPFDSAVGDMRVSQGP